MLLNEGSYKILKFKLEKDKDFFLWIRPQKMENLTLIETYFNYGYAPNVDLMNYAENITLPSGTFFSLKSAFNCNSDRLVRFLLWVKLILLL